MRTVCNRVRCCPTEIVGIYGCIDVLSPPIFFFLLFLFLFPFCFCPQSGDGHLVFNPGATLAVEIPARLLIANASSAGTDGGSAAAAPAATIDVAEQINMMNRRIDSLMDENAGLKSRVNDLETAAAAGTTANEDQVDEPSGTVVASGAFCAAWGSTLELLTGKVGSCEFPTVWKGDVVLKGWMVPLMKYVRKIEGYLFIHDQHYLESFSSVLPNLVEVTDSVTISSNNGLVRDVVGFGKLETVGGNVQIKDNKNLEVLDNKLFPVLKSAGDYVLISTNGKLTNMTDFMPSLNTTGKKKTGAGNVRIESNNDLEIMSNVFGALTTCGGVKIDNIQITSFGSASGFAKLEKSTGSITIDSNPGLLAIDGAFPSMLSTASIDIHNNVKLQSITSFGIPPQSSVGPLKLGGSFQLYENIKLADVSGFNAIECTATNKCAMNWQKNRALDKSDVCGVWTGMSGTGPLKTTQKCNHPGTGNFPCYGGSAGNIGSPANCS